MGFPCHADRGDPVGSDLWAPAGIMSLWGSWVHCPRLEHVLERALDRVVLSFLSCCPRVVTGLRDHRSSRQERYPPVSPTWEHFPVGLPAAAAVCGWGPVQIKCPPLITGEYRLIPHVGYLGLDVRLMQRARDRRLRALSRPMSKLSARVSLRPPPPVGL